MPGQYDAYSGGIYDPYAQGGVIGSEIIADPYGGYPTTVYPGVISGGDDFNARSNDAAPVPVPNPQQ